jgi:hypothetical protein
MPSSLVRLAAVAGALVALSVGAAPALASDPLVVQTGAKNYAGPSCPGLGWTCTTSGNVVQTATPGGRNVFVCAGDACTVTQTAVAGANRARCLQQGAAQSQSCTIVQVNQTGENVVVARQESRPDRAGAAADQRSAQTATLTQCNLTGANTAHVNQHIVHVAFDKTSPSVGQDQDASMVYDVVQSGPDPTFCATLPTAPPSDAAPCGSTSVDLLVAHQRVRQIASGRRARAGHQTQHSDIDGTITQCSEQPATYNASESEDQQLKAKSSGVNQDQVGPIRCCDKIRIIRPGAATAAADTPVGQSSSPDAACSLIQRTHQVTAPAETSDQHEDAIVQVTSTGSCDAGIHVVQGPKVVDQMLSTSGGTIDQHVSCDNTVCPTSRISYTGDPHRRTGRRPVLSVLVQDLAGNPLPGETVQYTLVSPSGDRTPLCSAVTNSDGVATCKAPFITADPGRYTIEASFTDPTSGQTFTASVPFRVRCIVGAPCR